jgi:hypothetical protein
VTQLIALGATIEEPTILVAPLISLLTTVIIVDRRGRSL